MGRGAVITADMTAEELRFCLRWQDLIGFDQLISDLELLWVRTRCERKLRTTFLRHEDCKCPCFDGAHSHVSAEGRDRWRFIQTDSLGHQKNEADPERSQSDTKSPRATQELKDLEADIRKRHGVESQS